MTRVCRGVVSLESDVNPLLVFAGFISSLALVLIMVICSITLYRNRRTRLRQLTTAATVLAGRKPAKHDTIDPRRTMPAGHEVIRLIATDDVRNYNINGSPLKTDAANV